MTIEAKLDTIPDSGLVDPLSILLKTAIAPVNSTNNVPTLSRDAPSLSESIVAITNSAAARTPTAPAILSKVSACKFFWYASRVSLTPPKISCTLSRNDIFSKVSDSVLTKLFIRTRNPLKRPLLNTSNIFPFPNAFDMVFPISSKTLTTALPIPLITPKNPCKNPAIPCNVMDSSALCFKDLPNSLTFEIPVDNVSIILETPLSNKLPSITDSLRFARYSPSELVNSNKSKLNPLKLLANSRIPFTPDFIASIPISKTEKIPLNVTFNFSPLESLIIRLSVNFLMFSVMLYNCSEVAFGKISRKASLIGDITFPSAVKEFLKDSIIEERPPRSTHPCIRSFLASADLLIISLRVSDTPVQSSFASSKSPIMSCHDLVQPDPSASCKVSISCENVLTFVAAFPAVLAKSAICFASS